MKNIKRFLKLGTLLVTVFIILNIANILYKEIRYPKMQKKADFDMNLFGSSLDHYYIDFIETKYIHGKKYYHFDKNGIPLFNGYYADWKYYDPIFISQFALGAHQYYLNTKDIDSKNIFIKCADWLEANLKKHGDFYYWEFNYENPFYPRGIYKVPNFSSMAQGEGASVLLRVFSLTKNDKYLEAAKKAITPVFYDISEGGISVVDDAKYIFPQEYPTNPPTNILNGAIFTYLGIYDFYRVTGDSDVKKYCDIIVNSIANNLENYDTGYWSSYCTWPQCLAPPYYNSVHVNQLQLLYLITNNKKFLHYSKKFEAYQRNWINRTRYVIANHLRQLREFSLDDMHKIPEFLKNPR